MRLLLKIIVGFLAIVGALVITIGAYLYWADPLGIRPLLKPATTAIDINAEDSSTDTSGNGLSPAQVEVLKKLGIDPAVIPNEISPELEQCLTNAVGEERAAQIKAGEAPTPMDLLKAKTCL